jgi:hypothetical protein
MRLRLRPLLANLIPQESVRAFSQRWLDAWESVEKAGEFFLAQRLFQF